METTLLLETHLKQLRLPTCVRTYRQVAEEAAHAHLGYDRFLWALAEQEVAQREKHRHAQLIRAARFPTLKELADVAFSCLPQLPKPQVLELARGEYSQTAAPLRLSGNPGLGKTPVATGVALAACRQGYTVRFDTAAGLVTELLPAQEDHRLPRVLATALTHQRIVLDE